MAKNILQDIVPPEKRSIRNIPVPQRRKTDLLNNYEAKASNVFVPAEKPIQKENSGPIDVIPPQQKKPPVVELEKTTYEPKIYSYAGNGIKGSTFGSKKILYGSIIGAVVIVSFAVVSLFGGATVTIEPAEAIGVVTANTTFTAAKNAIENELPFQIVTLTKTQSIEAPATGEDRVERKASGQIIIYNDFDSNSQRLIKNTRFETPEGLVYRINESVVVPGRKSDNGTIVPGQIETTVYADEAGEKYNIGKKDFTIPGFKGDPRFDRMYARSKTDMTNGFVGIERKVSAGDKAVAVSELQTKLTDDLQKDVLAQVPEDFVMFADAFSVKFKELPQGTADNSSVLINEEATLTGILFNKKIFAAYLAKSLDLPVAARPSEIININELAFVLQDKSGFNELTEKITFTLEGQPIFIAIIDTEELAGKLVNQPKKSLDEILASYPEIKAADSMIRPFWARTFPENAKDITIKVKQKSQ